MTGIRKHGQPAFRPAYGVLDNIRLLFKNIAFSAHSATLPPHMLKVVTSKLAMPSNLISINITSNRPGLVYATRRLVGATSNYNNLKLVRMVFGKALPATLVLILQSNEDYLESQKNQS
jgi:superfamily II DNA helicase RecQ